MSARWPIRISVELGLLEVGGDPEVVGHDRHQLLARLHVAAWRDVELGDVAVDRRGDAGVAERDVALPGLRLAGGVLRLERRDLHLGDADLGRGVLRLLHRREVLGGGVAGRLQRLVELLRRHRLRRRRPQIAIAGEIVGGLTGLRGGGGGVGVRLLEGGAGGDDLRALLADLRLRLRRLRVGLAVLGAEGRGIDVDDGLAGAHLGVVGDVDLDHHAGDLRGQVDDVAVDVGVVGRLPAARIQPPDDDADHHDRDDEADPDQQEEVPERAGLLRRLGGLAVRFGVITIVGPRRRLVFLRHARSAPHAHRPTGTGRTVRT